MQTCFRREIARADVQIGAWPPEVLLRLRWRRKRIPYGLINRAKKKIEVGKVRFDKTIATLQERTFQTRKTSLTLKEEESKAREESKKMETINSKIKQSSRVTRNCMTATRRRYTSGRKLRTSPRNISTTRIKGSHSRIPQDC
jgi:DNA mismatch repair protein MutS2